MVSRHFRLGRDYSTVDGRIKLKCYWTRASCDCKMLQNGDMTREMKFVSNDYSNPNNNPKILTTLALTLTDPMTLLIAFVLWYFVILYRTTPAPLMVQ